MVSISLTGLLSMSETLYRGLDAQTGEWEYGYYREIEGKPYLLIPRNDRYYEVVRETIGRSSGLRDVDTDTIYEGDIISYNKSHNKDVCTFCTEKGCFTVSGRKLSIVYSSSRILGNIYENPELLT